MATQDQHVDLEPDLEDVHEGNEAGLVQQPQHDPVEFVVVHDAEDTVRVAVLDADDVVVGVAVVSAADLDAGWLPQGATAVVEVDAEDRVAEGDHRVPGGWQPPAPTAPDAEATMRRDMDLLLQLVLTSPDEEANVVVSLAPTLRGMAERSSLTTAVVDGAFGWGALTSDERAELLAAPEGRST